MQAVLAKQSRASFTEAR